MINNRLLTEAHGVIGTLSNGKDVGRHLIPPLAPVHIDGPHGVDGETLVRVDGDTEEARVGVDQPLDVPLVQVEQDGGVVEVGQVGHVLAAVVLGRVDLPDHVLLELPDLALVGAHHQLHLHLVPVRLLDHSLWSGNNVESGELLARTITSTYFSSG